MKIPPGDEIGRPTARVSQPLRFREVCLFPPQLPCQHLLLGDVHGGAEKSFEHFLFDDGAGHAANVAHLPVGPNNSLGYVAATVLLKHRLNRFSHGGSVQGMDRSQILLKVWSPVFWIKYVNLVDLVVGVNYVEYQIERRIWFSS